MNIAFSAEAPTYQADGLELTFGALVDGARVDCTITAEALEDHFGAASLREPDLVSAFNAHRRTIEAAAARMLEETGGEPVVLHSGYFRLYGDR